MMVSTTYRLRTEIKGYLSATLGLPTYKEKQKLKKVFNFKDYVTD